MVKRVRDLDRRFPMGVIPAGGKYFPARSPWSDPSKRLIGSASFGEFRQYVLSEDRTLDRLVDRAGYTPIADDQIDPDVAQAAAEAIIDNLSDDMINRLVPSPAAIDGELAELLRSGGADLREADRTERVAVLASQSLPAVLLKQTTVKRSVAAQLLRVSLETIESLRRTGALVVTAEGVPRFQFTDDFSQLVPHLTEVLPVLPSGLDAPAIEEWFTTASEDFWIDDGPTSIRLWLCSGGAAEPVIAAAKSLLIT